MKKFCSIIIFSMLWMNIHATHIAGADIQYECMGGNSYLITLNIFRDCSGVSAPSVVDFIFFSSCGDDFEASFLEQDVGSGDEISLLCPDQVGESSCVNQKGKYHGMRKHVYSGLVNLDAPCDKWDIYWELCCRNPTVNLVKQPSMLIPASVYTDSKSCNNSPVFNADPNLYVCRNQVVNYNFGVSEGDGDSLVYRFTPPYTGIKGNGKYTEAAFSWGYNYLQPIKGITLNSATGQLQFTPEKLGNFVVAIEVCEYEHGTGNILGCVTRDIQFLSIDCINQNPIPPPSGIENFTGSGSLVSKDSVVICVGETFMFDVVFSDPDVANVVSLTSNISEIIPGATSVSQNGNPAVITIQGVAVEENVGLNTFVVEAVDDACPIPAKSSAGYNIVILPQPKVNAGPDQLVCSSKSEVNLVGEVKDVDGAIWSGVGIFGSPNTQLINTYTPTDAEIAKGSARLILTSQDLDGCTEVKDTVEITFDYLYASVILYTYDISCNGQADGSAELTVTGVNKPFDISWNTTPVQTTNMITGLTEGDYTVNITGSNGCDTNITVHVDEPEALVADINIINHVSCAGGNNGEVSIDILGGISPYTVKWDNQQVGQVIDVISDLEAGIHQITITDANACFIIKQVTINEPNAILDLTIDSKEPICFSSMDGELTANVTGTAAMAPFTYHWTPGDSTTASITHLGGGDYAVTVTDEMGSVK